MSGASFLLTPPPLVLQGRFPHPDTAWDWDSPAPGLLAMGGDLSVDTLVKAYSQGIFPWYSERQPILWWSPNPRMVLWVNDFHISHSLKKTIKKFADDPKCVIRIDTVFDQVLRHCATVARKGQNGTWMVPEMREAYLRLHGAGYAHSIETWVDDQLVGGLYCTVVGRAVFGESMFALRTDASKLALAALVKICQRHQVELIDCQQSTPHLTRLGANPMPRGEFLDQIATAASLELWAWRGESYTDLF